MNSLIDSQIGYLRTSGHLSGNPQKIGNIEPSTNLGGVEV